MTCGLSSACYDMVLYVVLLQRLMIVNMLKNNHRYSSHYIIKFVSFILIYCTINLNIISLYMVFSYLYLRYVNLLQV